ncbi:MAG: isochorismatase family protein [Gemmatimonadaceae bacterium]
MTTSRTPSSTPTYRRPRIGWVVDVQNDFMLPTGRLYVHHLSDPSDVGATNAADAITHAVRWMRANCDVVVYTGDWHAYGDREINTVDPDPMKETYPPHCMGLSPDPIERVGAALIAAIDPGDKAFVLERGADADDARYTARHAVTERRPVFIHKSEFSVFDGNPATVPFLTELEDTLGDAPEIVTCGVATDVCVKRAVDGFLDRGYRVRVVTDATWSLGLIDEDEMFARWQERGAKLTTTNDLAPAMR